MPHLMFGGLVHEQALTLATRLTALLPGDLTRVFFSDSGSVAVEVAMKMAVQYWMNCGEPKKIKFIAFKDGYHGDTQGAMAVSDPAIGMHGNFGSVQPHHTIIDVGTEPVENIAWDQAIFSSASRRNMRGSSSSLWCKALAA